MYIEEQFHWKEAIATVISLILGIVLIITAFDNGGNTYADIELIIGGLAIIVVSIAAFWLTDGWKHANDLPTGKIIIAYLPVFITGVALIALLIFLWIVKEALKDSFEQE